MRKALKFIHTLASCGLIGALLGYLIVLNFAPQDTPRGYADARQTIVSICNYLLIPSLAAALVSGLLSMLAHRPFLDTRWVWLKALLGLSMFEATLAIVQSKATAAAVEATRVLTGEGQPGALADALANEWLSLSAIMALSIAQVALGVWRPVLRNDKNCSCLFHRMKAKSCPATETHDLRMATWQCDLLMRDRGLQNTAWSPRSAVASRASRRA